MWVFPKWMVYNGIPFKMIDLGVLPLIFGNVQMVFMGSPCLPWWGLGVHPHSDPWGFAFGGDYCPDRARKAGSPISGCWTYALDGIQGDADFIAAIFSLNRPMAIIITSLYADTCFFFANHPTEVGLPIKHCLKYERFGSNWNQNQTRKLSTQPMLLPLLSTVSIPWRWSRFDTPVVHKLGPRCRVPKRVSRIAVHASPWQLLAHTSQPQNGFIVWFLLLFR
jgi:hypothetical protein